MRHVASPSTRSRSRCLSAGLLLAAAVASATPAPTLARCARIDVPVEAARSLYVFEGRLEAVDGRSLTFAVTAVWQGTPPERVTVGTSARRPFATDANVGATYLVFASGTDAGSLNIARCGSSGLLSIVGSTLAELLAMGRARVAR